jgi:diguanylate cyclase (GGDEF)-like protein
VRRADERLRTRRVHRRWALLAAAITLVVGVLITGVTATSMRAAAHRDAEEAFQQSATQTSGGLEKDVSTYFDGLRDVGAFVSSTSGATPDQFSTYVANAQVFTRLPSYAGLLYLSKVEDADLETFVAAQKAINDKFTFFAIGPHEPGTPHYILTYYEPRARDSASDLKLPIGTDTTPIRSLTDLLSDAGSSGQGITGAFNHDPLLKKIADETGGQTGFKAVTILVEDVQFFIGLPVFAPVAPGEPPRVMGWMGGPVDHFQDVVDEARRDQTGELGLSLTVDLTAAGMADRTDLSRVAQQEGNAGPRERAAFSTTHRFEIDDVTFEAAVWSTSTADDVPSTVTTFLLGGMLASLLGAAVVYLRFRAHDREVAFANELEDRAQFQRDIVDSVNNPMVVLDRDGSIIEANPAWLALRAGLRGADDRGDSGAGDADDGSTSYLTLLWPSVRAGEQSLSDEIDQVLSGRVDAVEVDVPIEQGARRRWFTVRATPLRGSHGGAVVVHTDITERKRSHDELEFKASRDNLTGLLNRLALEAEVDNALLRARADGTMVAALFIDLDGFKAVNDTYGHATGDDLLREVASRIGRAVRANDHVARLGGDEFVVLIAPLADPEVAEATAERILRVLRDPLEIGDQRIDLAASIGVAIVDAPLSGTSENLLERADHAMYEAKQSGGRGFRIAR